MELGWKNAGWDRLGLRGGKAKLANAGVPAQPESGGRACRDAVDSGAWCQYRRRATPSNGPGFGITRIHSQSFEKGDESGAFVLIEAGLHALFFTLPRTSDCLGCALGLRYGPVGSLQPVQAGDPRVASQGLSLVSCGSAGVGHCLEGRRNLGISGAGV